jgi:hypothetical protein
MKKHSDDVDNRCGEPLCLRMKSNGGSDRYIIHWSNTAFHPPNTGVEITVG